MKPPSKKRPSKLSASRVAFRFRSGRTRVENAVRESWYRTVRSRTDHLTWFLWERRWALDNSFLSTRNAWAHMSEECRIDVPLSRISYHIDFGPETPKRQFIWKGEWERIAVPLSEHHRYQMMEDIWQHRGRLETSATYNQLLSRIHAGKPRRIPNKGLYLDSPEAIIKFLQMQLILFESLERYGIRPEMAPDDPTVAVGRSGSLYKTNKGRKRTAAAKILGLGKMSMRISHIHEEWIEKHWLPNHRFRSDTVRAALKALQT